MKTWKLGDHVSTYVGRGVVNWVWTHPEGWQKLLVKLESNGSLVDIYGNQATVAEAAQKNDK